MRLAAALTTGFAVYLAVGAALGTMPRFARWPRPRRRSAQQRLLQAGAQVTPAQFRTGSAALGLLAFLLLTAITDAPAVAVVPALTAAALPSVWVARRRAQRLREVQQQWPDALRDLAAAVSAGMSLPQALVGLASSGPAALRPAFARFAALVRVLGVAGALELLKGELADPTSDRVVEVLVLAHERGGRVVADLLRDLADATADDVRTQEEVTTDGLEQRINGRAVFALPWLVLLVLTSRPGSFRDFYRSSGGIAVLVVAGLLSGLGAWLLGRLARDPEEERVFAPRPREGG